MMTTNVCSRCGSNTNLFLLTCNHATVCYKCGKSMAVTKEPCSECGVLVTNLHKVGLFHHSSFVSFFRSSNLTKSLSNQVSPLRVCKPNDKKYFAALFKIGEEPDYANDQWSLIKQSQSSDANAIDAELLNKDPWILENQAGIKYKGNPVDPSSSENFFLQEQDDGSFVAFPCADKYAQRRCLFFSFCGDVLVFLVGNSHSLFLFYRFLFERDHPGTHLTTEQAEEKMEKYREKADEKIQKLSKRLKTGQRNPTSTSENVDSLEKGKPVQGIRFVPLEFSL